MVKYCIIHSSDNSSEANWKPALESQSPNVAILTFDEICVECVVNDTFVKVREPNIIQQSRRVFSEHSHPFFSLKKEWIASNLPFLPEFKKQVN